MSAQPAATPATPPTPAAYRDFAMRRPGNAARGKILFASTEKAGCAQCHSTDGSSSRAGPDLMAVGDAIARRELIDAVLEPSATIAVGYELTVVETKAGATLSGVLKQANAERIELMGADGQRVTIPATDIKSRQTSPLSLMASGIHTAFTPQEFTDVVEFLASLRQPANSLSTARGMPEVIPKLAKPATLRPFLAEEHRFPAQTTPQPGDFRYGPVWFGQMPGSASTYFGLHQSGTIWRIEKSPGGDRKELFADFTAEVFSQRGPNGLVALAFHPRFRDNRKYYLKHQVLEDGEIRTVLVEKIAAPDFRTDSGTPSRRLLQIPGVTQNHTGGYITFGPDGYLYLGMGDTGPQQDPNGHGQDLSLPLGKILRLDVDGRDAGLPYAIPRDNPFRDRPGARPEIWALGFREPWRFEFDPVTGDLWVGDVGQNRVEEVTIVRRGENHGWNVYEAFEPFSNLRRRPGETFVPPVFAYRREYGNSITGGYVYRGDRNSPFYGAYICGDFTSRQIWALTHQDRVLTGIHQIAVAPESPASFGTDAQGRIFIVGYEGMIWELDLTTAELPAKR
jgi:putative heme-binding domain-containing protein